MAIPMNDPCVYSGCASAYLESVSKLDQGLQSFRSMRRMEASFKNARALRLRFSQSLASRRQRLSHAMVRSTIQRLGNCTNPLASGSFDDFGFETRQDFGEPVGKNRPLIGAVQTASRGMETGLSSSPEVRCR